MADGTQPPTKRAVELGVRILGLIERELDEQQRTNDVLAARVIELEARISGGMFDQEQAAKLVRALRTKLQEASDALGEKKLAAQLRDQIRETIRQSREFAP